MGETSEIIRKRVESAREIQNQRFVKSANSVCHADMRVAEVPQFCKLDEAGQAPIKATMSQVQISARAYQRILKLAACHR